MFSLARGGGATRALDGWCHRASMFAIIVSKQFFFTNKGCAKPRYSRATHFSHDADARRCRASSHATGSTDRSMVSRER